MSKIEVLNSCIKIHDYKLGQCPTLEGYFKIKVQVTKSYWRYEFCGLHYDEDNEVLYLPRGIDIWIVEKLLNTQADIPKNNYYKYKTFSGIRLKSLPRDDVQKKAVRFMIGQGEYNSTYTKSQLSVNLNTGKGKTYITIASIMYMQITSAIIMYSQELISQWEREILKYTDLTNKDICVVSGSNHIHRLLRTQKSKLNHKVYLLTHGTIKSFGDKYGWELVGDLFEHLGIGIKIFDEAHQNFENMYKIDFYTNVYKTYYLTATAMRSSDEENRIYQLSFKNVPAIELFNKEDDPHTSYTAIRYSSNPTPMEISKCKNQYGLDRNRYADYLVQKPNFYKMLTIIMNIVLSKTAYGHKCLMYIGTNNAIEVVYRWIIENYPFLYDNVGILSTLVSKEERLKAQQKRIILSTTKSAGAGIDIKGLKVTVILDEPFKSEVLARQTLGRTRDKNTLYIELVDRGFPQCVKYYNAKKNVFLTYATECTEIKLSQEELEARYNNLKYKNARAGIYYNVGLQKGIRYGGYVRGINYIT